MIKLNTKNTWCPGCGNFGIQQALIEIAEEKDKLVIVAGIGCHGKIADYLGVDSFSSLHGRAVAAAQGVKIANKELDVLCCVGDGDNYNEGVEHFIHAAKRNINITVLVHDNRAFALTARQFTATSPQGLKTGSTPKGSVEKPINPMSLAFACNASFIARGYSSKKDHLKDLIKRAVEHKGFSFVEVLQPCVAWFNTSSLYNEKVYEVEGPFALEEAKRVAGEWNYNDESSIPVGLFYQEEREVFEDTLNNRERVDIKEILKRAV